MQANPAEEHAALTAAATLHALRVTSTQLPLLHASDLISTAHDLLLLMHHVPAPSWRLGLAAAMNQQPYLQQVRAPCTARAKTRFCTQCVLVALFASAANCEPNVCARCTVHQQPNVCVLHS